MCKIGAAEEIYARFPDFLSKSKTAPLLDGALGSREPSPAASSPAPDLAVGPGPRLALRHAVVPLGLERDRGKQIIELAVEQVGRAELHLQGGLAVAWGRAPVAGERPAPGRFGAMRNVSATRTAREGGRSGGPTSSYPCASCTAAGAAAGAAPAPSSAALKNASTVWYWRAASPFA